MDRILIHVLDYDMAGGPPGVTTGSFEYFAFDSSGNGIFAEQGITIPGDSSTWGQNTDIMYENMRDFAHDAVLINTSIDVASDQIFFVGQPSTFEFPQTVHVDNMGINLLGGILIFSMVVAFLAFFFKRDSWI